MSDSSAPCARSSRRPSSHTSSTSCTALYPEARIVHIVRDGRDVACSLLEKPWLRPRQTRSDDAGLAYGAYARFWVEPDRREEFEEVSDARRAAWAWRSYVTAARSAAAPLVEVRYERLVDAPVGVADDLAAELDAPHDELAAALAHVHRSSVVATGDLDERQLADVLAEGQTSSPSSATFDPTG